MYMSNKAYDVMKWVAQLLLPALGTLYSALGALWNFPYIEQITGTIMAVDLFIGAILGISSANYNKDDGKN